MAGLRAYKGSIEALGGGGWVGLGLKNRQKC